MKSFTFSATILLTLGLLLLSAPTTSAQSSQCITACFNSNSHSTNCNPQTRESQYERCICDNLRALTPLVSCINKCPISEIGYYSDRVPDQCERELFPTAPRDSDDDDDRDDDNDDDDDIGGDSAGLVYNGTAGGNGNETGGNGNGGNNNNGENGNGNGGSAGVGLAGVRRDGLAVVGLGMLTAMVAVVL